MASFLDRSVLGSTAGPSIASRESNASLRVCRLAPLQPLPRLTARKFSVSVRASSPVDGADRSPGTGTGTRVAERTAEGSERPAAGSEEKFLESDEEVSSLMEGVSFAQLCDDFQCVSSPAIERTARQVARDIHDLREDKRTLSCFAVNVKYRDPLRSFTGREKFKRPSWILNALDRPRVDMISMEMTSTSELIIKWRLRGSFRVAPGDVDLLVTSNYTLNQISGQVTEQRDEWDLGKCPLPGIVAFYSSRLAWSTVQSSKDLQEAVKNVTKGREQDNSSVFMPDPSGDPRKFFVQDDPNRELYQYAFAVALLYLLVQFLRQVL